MTNIILVREPDNNITLYQAYSVHDTYMEAERAFNKLDANECAMIRSRDNHYTVYRWCIPSVKKVS